MTKNCLTCAWRSEPRTPHCSRKPEHAATCDYPLPSIGMIEFNVTDTRRHINLATILPDSEFFSPDHAARECRTWKARA
jgi:hypothetical protein